MKSYFSFFLVFAFFFASAQEIIDKEAFKKCKKEFNKKTCLADNDGDGVLNYLDACKDISGVTDNGGCPWPDSDNDGVLDKDDACPTVAGPFENNGCPWQDTDGDGIIDKDDKCPTVVGSYEKQGCPEGKSKEECKKEYEYEKKRYDRDLEELNSINFNKLFEKILLENDFKDYFSKNKERNVILYISYLNDMLRCGNEPKDYCTHYEKKISDEIFKKIWCKENFNKFKNRIGKRTIIPVIKSYSYNFHFQKKEDNFLYLNKIFPIYKGKIKFEEELANFYYISPEKPSKDLLLLINNDFEISNLKYIAFGIAIIKYDRYDSIPNSYIVQLRFGTNKNEFIATSKVYHFKDGDWIFFKNY